MKRACYFIFTGAVFATLLLAGCLSNKENPAENEADSSSLVEKDTSLTQFKFSVEEAPEWTALFRRKSGWFGGDGIFAIPLNGVDTAGAAADTTTLLLFSDSLIGEVDDENPEETTFKMINNSFALVEGTEPGEENISFHWPKDETGNPETVFIPNTRNSKPEDYYWLGDGFVNSAKNNDIYIFGYRINNTEAEVFGFEEVGNSLIIIPAGSKPPFADHRQIDTPFFINGDSPEEKGSFGAGIFANTREAGAPEPDGYVYVYGIRGQSKKDVLVARVKPEEFENFDEWRFWDGSSWQSNMDNAAPIADRGSNEMSVTPLPDGRYAMVFQTDGIGRTVGLRLGLSPQGPFGPVIPLWDCSEDIKMDKDFFCYNAKVHSNLSKPGELLISYNINSFDFFNDIKEHPNLYRPRFIRIKLE